MADQLFSSVPDSKTAEYLIAWDIVKLLYYDKRFYQGGEKLDHAKSIAEAYKQKYMELKKKYVDVIDEPDTDDAFGKGGTYERKYAADELEKMKNGYNSAKKGIGHNDFEQWINSAVSAGVTKLGEKARGDFEIGNDIIQFVHKGGNLDAELRKIAANAIKRIKEKRSWEE